MPFKDRADAGRKLAKALASYKEEQPVLLARPRGGVRVAAEVAAARASVAAAIIATRNDHPSS